MNVTRREERGDASTKHIPLLHEEHYAKGFAHYQKQKISNRSQQKIIPIGSPSSPSLVSSAVPKAFPPPPAVFPRSNQQPQNVKTTTKNRRVTVIPRLTSSLQIKKKHTRKRQRPSAISNQWTSVSTEKWGNHAHSSDDESNDEGDERQINAGVYLLENIKTGHCFFSTTWDLRNAEAQNFHDLNTGTHSHQALTRCYQLYGAEASGIRFRILERVSPPPLTTQKQIGKTKQEDTFDVKQMEVKLKKRLLFHQKKRIRKCTLQLIRRMMVLPLVQHYWPRWTEMVASQQNLEFHVAAVELQRLYRGYIGRMLVLTMRHSRAALIIQQCFRLCMAKTVTQRRRRAHLEARSATIIQRSVSHFLQHRRHEKHRKLIYKWLEARKIQAVYRGHRGRQVAAQMERQRQEHHASIVIQKYVRGHLARLQSQWKREFLRQTRAVVVIQKRRRGILGRRTFQQKRAETSTFQRRHEAAKKIQIMYWRFVQHKIQQAATQYTYQAEKATAIRMAYKNYVAKKFGWAATAFALETAMAKRIQRCAKRWLFFRRLRQLVHIYRRDLAARAIQRIARGRQGRQQYRTAKELMLQLNGAKRIQQAWRSHCFLRRVAMAVVLWRQARSALVLQTNYRCVRARREYNRIRTHARRHAAATKLQCLYQSRRARREWNRRLELRKLGACADCGDALANVYSFVVQMELCQSCLDNWQREQTLVNDSETKSVLLDSIPPHLQTLDVHVYRRLKTRLVPLQRGYRRLQHRLTAKFGVCGMCEQNAIRIHCATCLNTTRFCHSCDVAFHQQKSRTISSGHHQMHVRKPIEQLYAEDRAAIFLQKHFRRFQQRHTLSSLHLAKANAAAQRIQRVYLSHRQRRITRALYAARKKREQDELMAAVVLQRYLRGFLARKLLHQLKREHESANLIQKHIRGRRDRLITQQRRARRDAAIIIQRNIRGVQSRKQTALKRQQFLELQRQQAAITLQRHIRGLLARKMLLEKKKEAAALRIQCCWRCHMGRISLLQLIREREQRQLEEEADRQRQMALKRAELERIAAITIECTWRRYLAKKELSRLRIHRAQMWREKAHQQALEMEMANAVRIQRFIREKLTIKASQFRLRVHCCARQFLSRRILQRHRVERHAATRIQRAFRYSRVKRRLESLVSDTNNMTQTNSSHWVELFDETSGYVYYYNTLTMESSWEKPPELEDSDPTLTADNQNDTGADEGNQQSEWIECWDENVGATYYYNVQTGEATWAIPDGMENFGYDPTQTVWDGNQAPEDSWSDAEGWYGQYGAAPMPGKYQSFPSKSSKKLPYSGAMQYQISETNQALGSMVDEDVSSLQFSSEYDDPAALQHNETWLSDENNVEYGDEYGGYVYEYGQDDTAVDAEYDINYKIYMTQLERDQQRLQQQQQQSEQQISDQEDHIEQRQEDKKKET